MIESIIRRISEAYQNCPFVHAVVLGGSRATGTAEAESDIDIGIYYDGDSIDYAQLNAIAKALDDESRDNLICREGEWGNWVNCGGWLTIDNYPVDIILRDMSRVQRIIESTDRGEFSRHYQTGHPHAFMDMMYRGELASCKILFTRDESFLSAKKRAEIYPAALKKSVLEFFLFESKFSCWFAEKALNSADAYYLTGHIFRSVSAINNALFALNEKWLLNEKKAIFRIDAFDIAPESYSKKVNRIFTLSGSDPAAAVDMLKEICAEADSLTAPLFG